MLASDETREPSPDARRVLHSMDPRATAEPGRTVELLEWNSYAQVWTIQDSKVVRVEFFPTRGEALEAVGLRELGRPEHRSGRDHQP